MDEIRIELDCISDKTIGIKGIKYIPIKNSNNERRAIFKICCNKIFDNNIIIEEKINSILFLDNYGSINDNFSPEESKVFFLPNSTNYLQ